MRTVLVVKQQKEELMGDRRGYEPIITNLTNNKMEEPNKAVEQELVKSNLTEQAIAQMRQRFMSLKVIDSSDKVGYEAVSTARKEAKKFRVAIEKALKKLREPYVAFQKAVVAKEKDLSGQIEEIEDYLQAQEYIFKPREVEEVVEKPLTDQEKLKGYIVDILNVPLPEMSTDIGKEWLNKIVTDIKEAVKNFA